MLEVGEMLEISIIKVEDPGCLWGRTVKGPGVKVECPQQYKDLQVKMNLFYHDVNLDVKKVKPATLEKGQVCVVFWPALKSWCRATVESLLLGSAKSQATCFLVDHAERVVVNTEDVRAPLDKFLMLPFWVQKFRLARIHPMRLKVSIYNETAELVPSPHWDSSATKYLHNLLQASTLAESVFCGRDADCTDIELYLTIRNIKICVNDDLVVKKFACFSSEKALVSEHRSPASLAWDIFSSPQEILGMDGCCTLRSHPSHFLTRKRDDLLSLTEEPGKTHTPIDNSPGLAMKRFPPTGQMSDAEKLPNGTETCGGYDESTKGPTKCKNHKNLEQTENTENTLAEQLLKKLNLFRLMKFMNPLSLSNLNTQNQTVSDKAAEIPNHVSYSSTSDGPTELKEPASAEVWTSIDKYTCSRLLQLLNPDPINPNLESLDDSVTCCEPSKRLILVHSTVTVSPCSSITHAPITEQFRKFLLKRQYTGPGLGESYCWPSVARGCDTVLVCQNGDDPLSYIPPLLAQLQLASGFSALTAHTGPIAVILCPGWEKVESVLDLLDESGVGMSLHPAAILLGLGKDEAKHAKIPKNCQLLVTTPFSLVRLLEVYCFLFLRLSHLILDEAHELYTRAPQQMTAVLQHFQKVVSREERASCARQIVAVGTRWCRELEAVVRDHMVNPCVIITVMEEAALYGGVQQSVMLCLDCNKLSVLLSSLDFSPSVPQKTLLVTNSLEEVEHVYKALSNTEAFSLKVHEGLTYQYDIVIEQWKKGIGPGTQVILVTTNDCLKALGIRDATCVVHYGFPSSPKLFGNRLFCMYENFQNLSNKDCTEGSLHAVRSLLLLSERNACHVLGVLRYLKRTDALLPLELLQFAQGVQQAKEEQKTDRPLCNYLKSLGFCRDNGVCPDRHMISKTLDCPQHPDTGTVKVLPLYIKSANVYFGRIVNQKEDSYEKIAAEMKLHYAKESLCAKEVVEGGIYAVQEDDVYHRVHVTEVPDKGDRIFSSIIAHFIDEGYTQEVKSHQLLKLPVDFQHLPGQAVEIVLCRVQPIDGERDWNPKVTRAISAKIKGKIHQAKIVMCLGNTVWVDPMVCMTRVPGLKTLINEYNVHTEILATGLGTTNPQHVELLKSLCQGELTSAIVESIDCNGCDSVQVSLEQRVHVAEEVLLSTMKAGIPRTNSGVEPNADCTGSESHEPSDKLKDTQQITTPSGGSSGVCLEACLLEDEDMVRLLPQNYTADISNMVAKDDGKRQNDALNTEEAQDLDLPKSFHPHIKWFQDEQTVTLTVKLINPMMQKCEFFLDRVLYSAYMNSSHYRADLVLSGDIRTGQCCWEMKCNEPLIKLVKKVKGPWKSLLRYKSAFVSYDFDHIEDEDLYVPNGSWFEGNTGEEGCYVSSESATESD